MNNLSNETAYLGGHRFHTDVYSAQCRFSDHAPSAAPAGDLAAFLDSDDAQHAFLNDALAIGQTGVIAAALGLVARVRGMSAMAGETGMSRQQLYRALSADGNPTLETLTRVVTALGYRLAVERAAPAARGRVAA